MNTISWYYRLRRPWFAPPAWVFGPVWSVLYLLIGVTFFMLLSSYAQGKISGFVFVPFGLNLFFNAFFTPLQFGLRSNLLACIDIFLVLGTLIWELALLYSIVPWIALIQIPYLLWVSFATILQCSITYLNASSKY